MVILAVSDVHLGYPNSNATKFKAFLNYVYSLDQVEHFVILGDFVDMWRRDVSGLFLEKENYEIVPLLMKLNLDHNVQIECVAGNHDFHLRKLQAVDYPLKFQESVGDNPLKIPVNGVNYIFKHGYEFDIMQSDILSELLCYNFSDFAGNLRSDFWKKLLALRPDISKEIGRLINKIRAKKSNRRVVAETSSATCDMESLKIEYLEILMASPNKRKNYKNKELTAIRPEIANPLHSVAENAARSVNKGEVLIFGHTHLPFVNDDHRLFNTGSWLEDESDPYTFVSIEGEKVCLMQFNEKNEATDITDLDHFKQSHKLRPEAY